MSKRLLMEIKKTIEASDTYKDYPSERYFVDPLSVSPDEAKNVPEGPWDAKNTDLPTPEQAAAFTAAGYTIDSFGRPLHPYFFEMVSDERVGVVGGRGFYRNWGPNYTADPIVITRTAQPRVLLIKRGDTGAWALPGGFVDPADDTVEAAAKRELKEEAGLELTLPATEIYTGVVGDVRTTAHAWAETSAYLMQIDRQVPVLAADDAKDAMWVRLDKLDAKLFGSHNFLINEAIPTAEYKVATPIADILALPKEQLSIEIIDAGHMAYDHFFVTTDDSCLFVKEHDASRFTDSFREAHSRAYLEKEFDLYEHVAERGFSFIPDRVDLIDDSLLAMDALRVEDGWQWRAPRTDTHAFDLYTRDILEALTQLQCVKIPTRPRYHAAINPTHETFWTEGWDDISDDTVHPLIDRMHTLSAHWTDAQQHFVQELIDDLPRLMEAAKFLDRDPELFMAHNDARQSNIAWKKDEGARIVDWSWADPAPQNADATMFLIDLAKSGYDVRPYVDYINKDQLILLIGMWLGHCRWNTRDGSLTVRQQQLASAVAAHQLLDLL